MTTKILLHGGNADRDTEKNEKFYNEIINGFEGKAMKILCVYFARPERRWEDSYYDDQITFKRLERETGLEIETRLAKSADTDDFIQDISWADVVFINGGMRGYLKETLLKIGEKRFWSLLNDKILVGISAGANVLSKYYYSMATGGIREGAGFLDIKILTHYSEHEPEKFETLKKHGEDLPLITIREEEYVVLRQSS